MTDINRIDRELAESEARTFLNLLFGAKPDNLFILLWERLERKVSYWFTDPERAAEFVQNHNVNLYVGVALSPADYGPHSRCKAADVAGLVGLWADLDIAGPAHQKPNLPPTEQDALSLLPPEFPPSVTVNSGHGLQAWWLFKEPWIFDTAGERDQAQQLTQKWQRFLELRARMRDWAIDPVADLARVLRLPGTINRKEGLPDAVARILNTTDRRYNPSDLEEFLDIPALAQPERPKAPLMEIASGLTYDPQAQFSPNILAVLCEYDPRFRMTWEGNRPDLKDRSQNAYDLAIANALVKLGLPDQEIVNAMIHHRRKRNQKWKKTPADYYPRTLGRAKAQVQAQAPQHDAPPANPEAPTQMLTSPDQVPASAPSSPTPAPVAKAAAEVPEAPAPDADPAKKIEFLRSTLGLPITRILWIRGREGGKSAMWRFELTGGEIVTLTSAQQIIDSGRFRAAVMSQINGKVAFLKPATWQKVIVPIIQDCIIEIEAGSESDPRAEIRELLDSYLVDRSIISRQEAYTQPAQNDRPFEHEGQIAIRVADFREWLFRTRGIRKENSEITNALHAIGTKQKSFFIPQRNTTQSRWILPDTMPARIYRDASESSRLGACTEAVGEPEWTN